MAIHTRDFADALAGAAPDLAQQLRAAEDPARILAEDPHHALASNYFTFGTDRLDG